MSRKSLVMIGMVVGSFAGSWIPSLWGDGFLSVSSILISAAGGILGIWAAWKLSESIF